MTGRAVVLALLALIMVLLLAALCFAVYALVITGAVTCQW
jgi:hypothetical protein